MSPSANVTWPGMSSLRPAGADESRVANERMTSATATAAMIQYDTRQPLNTLGWPAAPGIVRNCAVRPAMTGEMTAPRDRNPAHVAITRDRLALSGVSAETIASPIGNSRPAPMPITAWAKIMKPMVVASADSAAPATTSTPPATSSFFRPKRSPSRPNVSSNATMPISKIAVIQVRPAPVAWNSAANAPLRAPGTA